MVMHLSDIATNVFQQQTTTIRRLNIHGTFQGH